MGIWIRTSSLCPSRPAPASTMSDPATARAVAGWTTGAAGTMSRVARPAPLSRRRFLEAAGGAALMAATVLAGCDRTGGQPGVTVGAEPAHAPPPSTTTTTTSPPVDPASELDIVVLSTASSIEHYAAGVYTEAVGLDVVTSPALIAAMELFADHHSQHASAFEAATQQAGGIPYTQPNPALRLAALEQLAAIRAELDVVRLVFLVERVAAATYMANVGRFSDPALNGSIMAVGAVEARHMTALASLASHQPGLGSPLPAWPSSGFASTAGAISPGAGM